MSRFVRIARVFTLVIVSATSAAAASTVAQSLIVDFPVSGRVTVQAREEIDHFPQMVFISEKTRKTLLAASIEDRDKWLIPVAGDSPGMSPCLRFRVIRSAGQRTPIIMSVGLFTGGSDNQYFLTLFGEVGGKILRLNEKPIFANVQGGYYFGRLNDKYGSGLAVWNFVWAEGPHYGKHKYAIELYRVQGGRLKRFVRTTSKKAYDSNRGARSLRELGIRAIDQRNGVPRIKETLD